MCLCSQECISKSAIQTKFESHAVSGLKITTMVKVLMEQIVGCAFQQRLVNWNKYFWSIFSQSFSWEMLSQYWMFFCHRTKLEKAKKEQEDRLEYVKEQLEICSHDSKRQIKEITAKVEAQVKNFETDHFTFRSAIYRAYSIIDGKEIIQRTVTSEVFKAFTGTPHHHSYSQHFLLAFGRNYSFWIFVHSCGHDLQQVVHERLNLQCQYKI